MRQKLFGALVVLALVTAAAPASAANKEHQQLMADIRMLQEQSVLLQNMLATLTELLKTMNTHLDQRFDQQNNVLVKGFADQKLILDNLSNDARVIRERLDDNNVRIGSLSQELEALRQAVQQRSTTTPDADAAAAAAGSAPTAGGTGAVPTAGTPVVALSPQKMQDAANADYAAGQYDLAIDGFNAYIKNFPKSDWADDAQLLICRSFENEAKYPQALDACDAVIRNYPNGNSVPDAYYHKGLAQKALKDTDAARATWETLINNYKDSTAAQLAQQALQGLKRPQ
jgi:tol-pal system protein YbgF